MQPNTLLRQHGRNIDFTEEDWMVLRRIYGWCCPFTNKQHNLKIISDAAPQLRKRKNGCEGHRSISNAEQKLGKKHYNTPIHFQDASQDNAVIHSRKSNLSSRKPLNSEWLKHFESEMLNKSMSRVLMDAIQMTLKFSTEIVEIESSWCRLMQSNKKKPAKKKRKKKIEGIRKDDYSQSKPQEVEKIETKPQEVEKIETKPQEVEKIETKPQEVEKIETRNPPIQNSASFKITSLSRIQEMSNLLMNSSTDSSKLIIARTCKFVQTTPGLEANINDALTLSQSQQKSIVKGDGSMYKNEGTQIKSEELIHMEQLTKEFQAPKVKKQKTPAKLVKENKDQNLALKNDETTIEKPKSLVNKSDQTTVKKLKPQKTKTTKNPEGLEFKDDGTIFMNREFTTVKPLPRPKQMSFDLDTVDKNILKNRVDYVTNYSFEDFEHQTIPSLKASSHNNDNHTPVNNGEILIKSNPKIVNKQNQEYLYKLKDALLNRPPKTEPMTIKKKSVKPVRFLKPLKPLKPKKIRRHQSIPSLNSHRSKPPTKPKDCDKKTEKSKPLEKTVVPFKPPAISRRINHPLPSGNQFPPQSELMKKYLNCRKSYPTDINWDNPEGDDLDLYKNSDSLATDNVSELEFTISNNSQASSPQKDNMNAKLNEFMSNLVQLSRTNKSGISLDERFKILHLKNMEKMRLIWSRGGSIVSMKTIRTLVSLCVRNGHLYPIRKGSGKYFLGSQWIMLKPF